MVGNSSFITNSISTPRAPNGIGNNGGNSNSTNITGSSSIARNGTGLAGKSVPDVSSTSAGSLASVAGNNVVNVGNGCYLHTHQSHLIASGVTFPAVGSTTNSAVSAGGTNRLNTLPGPQPIAGGMINHSSLMFATNNHQQQLAVISNAATPVSSLGAADKRTVAANSKTNPDSIATSTVASATNTTITSSTTSTSVSSIPNNTPTDSGATGATELPLETKELNPEDDDEPEIDIVINNVVCSFSVRCHLNLHEIARNGHNVEFRRENGMVTMKIRRPYTTASIWSSGKITCTGATSEQQAKIAARRYSRCLQKLGFNVRFRNFRIVNVLGTCSMPWGIMIVNFSEKYKKDASYEPELHPGVTYKLQTPKATLKIFSTGSITVTAASVAFVQAAIEQIFPLVYEFRKKRTPLEKQNMIKQPPAFDPHDVDHLIEEDCESAIAEAEDPTHWNGTADAAHGDDEVRIRKHTKAIHKMNSIRQNGKKVRVRQLRPSGRAVNDCDSMSDDEMSVSDIE